jgi:hypothetical protein
MALTLVPSEDIPTPIVREGRDADLPALLASFLEAKGFQHQIIVGEKGFDEVYTDGRITIPMPQNITEEYVVQQLGRAEQSAAEAQLSLVAG